MVYTNILKITLLNAITGTFARPQNENEDLTDDDTIYYTVEDQVELSFSEKFYSTGQFWIVMGILTAMMAVVGIIIWKKNKKASLQFS